MIVQDPNSRAPYPWIDFLMVIKASGVVHGRIHTTTTATVAESREIAANGLRETCTLGLYRTSLILDIHFMVNWHLSIQGIHWPVSHDHISWAQWGFQLPGPGAPLLGLAKSISYFKEECLLSIRYLLGQFSVTGKWLLKLAHAYKICSKNKETVKKKKLWFCCPYSYQHQ